MVGQQLAIGRQFLDRREEAHEPRGIVEIRRRVAQLTEDLRQRRATQAVLAGAQVHQEQFGFAWLHAELGRECAANVFRRREGGDNE